MQLSVQYSYPTRKFCKFFESNMPVPDSSVSSVSLPYPHPTIPALKSPKYPYPWHGYTLEKMFESEYRFLVGIHTHTRHLHGAACPPYPHPTSLQDLKGIFTLIPGWGIPFKKYPRPRVPVNVHTLSDGLCKFCKTFIPLPIVLSSLWVTPYPTELTHTLQNKTLGSHTFLCLPYEYVA